MAGETSVTDGVAGRDGAFGARAATKEWVFWDGAAGEGVFEAPTAAWEGVFRERTFWDGPVVNGTFGDGDATCTGVFRDGVFWDGVVGEEAFVGRPALDEPARIRSSSSSPVCVRGAITCSTAALARLSPTWPLTTSV
jgi:hypothetical protein